MAFYGPPAQSPDHPRPRRRWLRREPPARAFPPYPAPGPPAGFPAGLPAGLPFEPEAPVGSTRWVAVLGADHDAGTTTVAALLSLAYATHRRYRIVAVDAQATAANRQAAAVDPPAAGALGARLATRAAAGIAQVASAEVPSFDALTPYLDRSAEGMWTLTGAAGTTPGPEQCRIAIGTLSQHFAVGVLDCGPLGAPLVDTLVDLAHAHLLVAPATAEGVLSAACALDWLGARRNSAEPWHCGVALVSTSRHPDTDVGWATRLLTGRGGRAIPVPYDSGLVAGRISPASVSDGTWAAARRLAGEMLSRAARPQAPRWGEG